jgi:16S rRNA processing protein RimM
VAREAVRVDSTDASERSGEDWIAVGRLGKTFGLHGEIVVHRLTDSDETFRPGKEFVLASRRERREVCIAALRELPTKLVVRFEGLDSVEDIQPWVGSTLEVRARELPELEEGSYYHFQLIGLEVYAADGRLLGTLEEILETAGNDVFCVRDGRREILVPAIRDAIASIDPQAGRVVLKDMEGLIEP